ncbi:flagellar hook-length control protein FliK [Paenibacillus roseipurpureus]|uniref:Flagellar hook-length control protein FliK n=1 Tax=Paenibacillus roseopurpureus TaxID=2918901 RepID=A0AA96LV64_9BACL|nr:flagellar hook-length control protein FliK [Paenibacillus sp. MBLB1832]WNR46648.1 flagellar hook-length control protein FliK [Paenibacillus sp. MBLB1832]
MDAMMASVPAVQTGTTNSAATGKGSAKGSPTTDSFSVLLAGQTNQDGASKGEGQPTDAELSLSMMLQMLQTLINPLQPIVELGDASQSDETKLPELLLEAMNANPALADTIMQDPKLKKWFENADELLAALGNSVATTGTSNAVNMPFLVQQQSTTDSLKVQNTLLSLITLSKQQPDNLILKFLQEDLAKAVEPILPELLAGLKDPQSTAVVTDQANLKGSNETVTASKKQVSAIDRLSHHKYINQREVDPSVQSDVLGNGQVALPKQERFALKNVPTIMQEQSAPSSTESTVPLVDLPIETDVIANPILTIGDLQKLQQAAIAADKTAPTVITAANFTEEMTTHVLKNMKITLSEGFSEAKLSLFPKNLGHIDVKITMQDGQLFAQFAADSLAGKQLLESQLPQLRQALLTQGLQVEKLEVTQSEQMPSGMFQEQRQPQSFNQSNRQSTKNRSNAIDVDAIGFNEDVEQLTQISNQTNGNGSSLDVTA